MPRVRKPITPTLKGNVYLARFKHPVLKRTICFSFGDAKVAKENTDALNTIFMNPALWHNPPATTPEDVLRQWNPGNTVTLSKGVPKKGGKPLKTDGAEVARLRTENDALHAKVNELLGIIAAKDRELDHWRGKKTTKGPSPTLEKARENFMKAYKAGTLSRKPGRIPDADAVKNIEWDLKRFTAKFNETTPADYFDEIEHAKELSTWIHGQKNASGATLSSTRRMQMRVYVLKMLEHAGGQPDRKAVERPHMNTSATVNDTTKKGNGVITYLTRDEAVKVADMLPQPWADMFRVQVALGLRPDECLTLHKNNFAAGLTALNLTPLVFTDRFGATVTLTLKTGPRSVPVPAGIRDIIKARLKRNAVVFADADGFAWNDPKKFNRQFKAALVKAAKRARIKKTMDSRIARRTCASWLMQAEVSAEKIAALLGNSPEMIREHYGDPDVMGMDLSKTTV